MTFIIVSIIMRWLDSSDNTIWFTVLHFYISIICSSTLQPCYHCHLQLIISTCLLTIACTTATIRSLLGSQLYWVTNFNTDTSITRLHLLLQRPSTILVVGPPILMHRPLTTPVLLSLPAVYVLVQTGASLPLGVVGVASMVLVDGTRGIVG